MQCSRLKLQYCNVMRPFIYDPIKKCFQRINFPLVFLLQFIFSKRFMIRAIAQPKTEKFTFCIGISLTRLEEKKKTCHHHQCCRSKTSSSVSMHNYSCKPIVRNAHNEQQNEKLYQHRVFNVHLCFR